MKKILSILLSVMLILGTVSVLMLLPAAATDGQDAVAGPVNLLENGRGTEGKYGEDKAPNLEDYNDQSWKDGLGKYFSYYSGEGFAKYYPRGWRVTGTLWSNLDYSCMRRDNKDVVDTGVYMSYDDPADAYAIIMNRWQQAYQDFVIEAGKYYTVSADLTLVPYTATVADTWKVDMFVDTFCWDNEGTIAVDEANIVAGTTGRNPWKYAPTGYAWNLINTDQERADMNAHILANNSFYSSVYSSTYYNSGDFKNYSFTFSADEFLAANNGAVKDNGDGTYTVRLVISNDTDAWLAFDNVAVYECAAVAATDGGVIIDNSTGETVDAMVCEAGEEISVTANPYYGNSFDGWYQGETRVSTNPTYTGEVTGSLVAKFTVYNQIVDGNFESGTNDFITAVDPSSFDGASSYPRVLEVVDAPAGSDAAKHGNKVLSARFESVEKMGDYRYCRSLVAIPVTVKPNTSYVLSYSMYLNLSDTDHTMMRISDREGWWTGTMTLAEWSAYTYPESSAPGADTTGWKYYAGKNELFNPGEFMNRAIYSPKTWQVNHGYIKTGDKTSAPFNGADSITAYIIIGNEGSVPAELCHIYLDNICFAEEAASAPSGGTPSITSVGGGSVSTVGTATAPVSVYKISNHMTYDATDFTTPRYASAGANTVVATATPGWGAEFTGWTKDGAQYSTDATITISDNASYVANFSGNLIANGDFSLNDTSMIVENNSNYTTTRITEGDNSYVRLSSSGAWKYEAFGVPFTVEKGKKYVVSYRLRSSVDANGDFLSANGATLVRGIRVYDEDLDVQGALWPWGATTFASAASFINGSKQSWAPSITSWLDGRDLLREDGNDDSVYSTYGYVNSKSEWTYYSYILDTATLHIGDTDLFANDNVETLALSFGSAHDYAYSVDVDDIAVSEYVDTFSATAETGGTAVISSKYSAVGVPVTYMAHPQDGYEFAGWYDSSDALVSENAVYTAPADVDVTAGTEYNLTAKFAESTETVDLNTVGGFEADAGVTSDFDLSTITTLYSASHTASVKDYDPENLPAGYTADMGSSYLEVVDASNSIDIAIPVKVKANVKKIVHLNFYVNAPETYDEYADRFDVRVHKHGEWWATPDNATGKIVISTANGKNTWDDLGSCFAYWSSLETNEQQGIIDIYIMVESTVDQTVDIGVGCWLNSNETMLFDNIWAYDEDELVSLNGASLVAEEDAKLTGMTYITEVNLPTGLATNMISTYAASSARLEDEAEASKYTFTDATNEGLETKLVATARMKAAEGDVIKHTVGEVETSFTSGKLYNTFRFNPDEFNKTVKYAVRSEIALTDSYGNDLGMTISTNNGENGLYNRPVNQVKRLMAKTLMTDKGIMALDIEVPPVDGRSKWNSADIASVWNFVLDYKNYLG